MRRLIAPFVAWWLFMQGGVIAQERPIAVSTLTTTDTGVASVCVGCAVGASAATGGLQAGKLTAENAAAVMVDATAGSNNGQRISITNTTSSTGSLAGYLLTAGTATGVLDVFAQGYSTSGVNIASSVKLESTSVGGLNLSASSASGAIGLWTNGALRWGINAAGDRTFGPSSHIADSNGTPAIQSGFFVSGVTPATIAGTDYAFIVTYGTGAGNVGGVVQFGHTFTSAPICVSIQDGVTISTSDTTTTTITLVVPASTYTGKVVKVLCRGY